MIWSKETFSFPNKKRYHDTFEYMFVISKEMPNTSNLIKDRKNKWVGTKIHGTSRNTDGSIFRKSNHNRTTVNDYGVRYNVWDVCTEKQNKTGHPAVFPYQLARDHIISWSNENDIVLDCFSGSGTTAVACHRLKRNFICIEKDLDYYKASIKRLEDEQRQGVLF